MSDRLDTDTVVDGRYKVERRLGSGGMADVYLATDLQLGRRVALKILYRRFSEDPEFVERFRREASAAAGLQHQHVVSVYDRGEWEGTYYIAMEYLEGRSLKALIAQEAPLAPDVAIDYATQILKAARFAHRINFVHLRNVFRREDGHFTETDHLTGDIDIYGVMKVLVAEEQRRRTGHLPAARLPFRPDHGLLMTPDMQRTGIYPGYSLFGRMRGLAELRGLELGIRRSLAL